MFNKDMLKGKQKVMEGVVEKMSAPSWRGVRTEVRLLTGPRLLLYIKGAEYDTFYPGSLIRFYAAKIERIKNRSDRHGNGFDAVSWWMQKNIMFKAYTHYPMMCIAVGEKKGILTRIETMRLKIIALLKKCLSSNKRVFGLSVALLTGEKAWIPYRLKKVFYAAGIGHILAVSGLHMTIAAGLTGWFLAVMLLRSPTLSLLLPVRPIASLVGCLASLCYAMLAGFSPSSLRSFIMITAFGISFAIKRRTFSMGSLFLACWVCLLINPLFLKNPGFLLSFSAVFFLILYGKWIRGKGEDSPFFLCYFASLIRLSLIAWLATAPITIYFFREVSLVSIFSNIIAIPILSLFILPLLIIGLLLAAIHLKIPLFYGLLSVGLNALMDIASIFHVINMKIAHFLRLTSHISFFYEGSLAPAFICFYYTALFVIGIRVYLLNATSITN